MKICNISLVLAVKSSGRVDILVWLDLVVVGWALAIWAPTSLCNVGIANSTVLEGYPKRSSKHIFSVDPDPPVV